jgi:hypothetical protein
MRLTLGELRNFIAEEVDRLVRRSAGFSGIAGLGGRARGSIELPPLNLGDEEQQEERGYGKEQEKSQFAPRVDSRRRASRQD